MEVNKINSERIDFSVLTPDVNSFDKVLTFLKNVDKSFPVPLSERTDLNVYTKRILDKAVVLQASIDDTLIGLSSFYANDLINMKSHLTLIAVDGKYMNKGIATQLVRQMLNLLESQNMVSVDVTTGTNNTAARKLYEKMNFILIEEDDERVKYLYRFKD